MCRLASNEEYAMGLFGDFVNGCFLQADALLCFHRPLQKLAAKEESSNMVSCFQSFMKNVMFFSMNRVIF